MTKRTMTPEEREWEANREERYQWTLRVLNERWREMQHERARPAGSGLRRRLFPWRIRIQRLD
jgi:hypothetical protein